MLTDKEKEWIIGTFLARGKDALLYLVDSLVEDSYEKGY